ncbi:hypothetical protein NY2A_b616L [Paramecium bursaria Chlorella virus NY2A]|uniref:Uncharacterized protein b616L n=1 Tax=Paramecium bursaria Chlorella virus NY2A TaxID=46021 RepID=A7IXE1_PBCVN|nr:hypothetical protein NY2A_b616L [Paramecium bursaria Chlorella virus NY2A]ABT15015.1 hypothetical protein NY2A_b616L [Paramecium bursaria Chlorella virus NY2A]
MQHRCHLSCCSARKHRDRDCEHRHPSDRSQHLCKELQRSENHEWNGWTRVRELNILCFSTFQTTHSVF